MILRLLCLTVADPQRAAFQIPIPRQSGSGTGWLHREACGEACVYAAFVESLFLFGTSNRRDAHTTTWSESLRHQLGTRDGIEMSGICSPAFQGLHSNNRCAFDQETVVAIGENNLSELDPLRTLDGYFENDTREGCWCNLPSLKSTSQRPFWSSFIWRCSRL